MGHEYPNLPSDNSSDHHQLLVAIQVLTLSRLDKIASCVWGRPEELHCAAITS